MADYSATTTLVTNSEALPTSLADKLLKTFQFPVSPKTPLISLSEISTPSTPKKDARRRRSTTSSIFLFSNKNRHWIRRFYLPKINLNPLIKCIFCLFQNIIPFQRLGRKSYITIIIFWVF